jgi:uncharacterized protein (TIGR02391 family)
MPTIPIHELIPDAHTLLELEPEELAGYLLEHFNSMPAEEERLINRLNFSGTTSVEGYQQDEQFSCRRAMMEAWMFLEREGLIAYRPFDGDQGPYFFVTRRGKSYTTHIDFESFQRASIFPREILPEELRGAAYPMFLRGQYESAVLESYRLLEIRVREACHSKDPSFNKATIGRELMARAFDEQTGLLADKTEPVAERESLKLLFMGAIGRFKNPASHCHVPFEDSVEAAQLISFAGHLYDLVAGRS